MHLIHAATELGPGKACVAIGMFDGVHLGHQQVIRQALGDASRHEARAVVITFDRHPNAVVAPERVPPMIYTPPQKLRAIAALGVDTTLVLRFDEALSRLSGEEFVRGLADGFGRIVSICVGSTFTFGHRRAGNVALLQKLGGEMHFVVHGLAAVALDGVVISSTQIRNCIAQGKLDEAGQMLGRPCTLAGSVARGAQIGRTLGFPTANLEVTGLALPPNGVYAVHARIHGKARRGAMNIGFRPTVMEPVPRVHVEVHLLDFDGDLYEEEIEVQFVAKLRDEMKFPSLDALKAQIAEDIRRTRDLFDSGL